MCVGLGSPLAGFGPPVPAGGCARFRSAALGAVLLAFLPRRRLGSAVAVRSSFRPSSRSASVCPVSGRCSVPSGVSVPRGVRLGVSLRRSARLLGWSFSL